MPELPEVETTRKGITPHICGQKLTQVNIRQPNLRWPVSENLAYRLQGQTLLNIERRAKYLLFQFPCGYLLIHLGMSGSLRIVPYNSVIAKHDHIDICFESQQILRYTDPRRFGAVLWLGTAPLQHKLLRNLGPEPLSEDFNAQHLYQYSRNKKQAIKQFLMDQKIVTGVGNIYANEALYSSGINPKTQAGRIAQQRYQKLVAVVKQVLQQAIAEGGTTLRDFVGGDGKPGYFKQQLHVYGRGGEPCHGCQETLVEIRLSGRSSVYCRHCQR